MAPCLTRRFFSRNDQKERASNRPFFPLDHDPCQPLIGSASLLRSEGSLPLNRAESGSVVEPESFGKRVASSLHRSATILLAR